MYIVYLLKTFYLPLALQFDYCLRFGMKGSGTAYNFAGEQIFRERLKKPNTKMSVVYAKKG
jgi:hypothetical protein